MTVTTVIAGQVMHIRTTVEQPHYVDVPSEQGTPEDLIERGKTCADGTVAQTQRNEG